MSEWVVNNLRHRRGKGYGISCSSCKARNYGEHGDMIKSERLQIVALGANVASSSGAPARTLHDALIALAVEGFLIRAVSRFFRTPCFPVGAGPDYVNAVIAVRASGTPAQTLARLHSIEADFGRKRVQRWGQRTLDLDLIADGGAVLPDATTFRHWYDLDPALQAKAAPDRLILPHPRLADRAFVLVPLADIAPDWHHPVLGISTRQMLEALPTESLRDIQPIR